MDLLPVENSSNIEAAGFDAESSTMRVRFKGGKTYDYFGVDTAVFDTFLESPSKGTYLASVIKPAHPASIVTDED